MTTLRDMPMITIEQKNRFREAALETEQDRDEAKRMLASACEYLSRVSVLVGAQDDEDPQTIVEMVEGVVLERDKLRKKSDRLDRAVSVEIDNRDRMEEWADGLADWIAKLTGVELGEHSSCNCPWANAVQAAAEFECSLARRDARMKAEALKELAAQPGMEHFTASRSTKALAAEYRKQAEGEA